MKPLYKAIIWFILVIAMLNIAFSLINKASSVANMVGLVIIFLTIYISDKTKLFTNIKIKKNEKNN